MNLKTLVAIGIVSTMILTGCGQAADQQDTAQNGVSFEKVAEATEQTSTQIANPWTESDKAGVAEATGYEMEAPAEAVDVDYSYMGAEGMSQMTYTLDGEEWTYRIQPASELTDISGMNYEWDATVDGTVAGMDAVYMSHVVPSEDGDSSIGVSDVQVVNWYDAVTGNTYSLSVTGKDLNGMDIQVFAESIYQPLQGEEVSADDEAAEIKDYFLGEHVKSDDESKLTITDNEDGSYQVDISITRLADLSEGVAYFEEHKMVFSVKDPNGKEMLGVIYRDADNSLVVKITSSDWEYLKTDDQIEGFGK